MRKNSGVGLKEALEGAFTQFVETRITEGENLKKDLLEKLDGILEDVEAIEKTVSGDRHRIPMQS